MTSSSIGSVFLISGLLEIIIPTVFSFYIIRRFNTSWRTWMIGALMFLASLIRVPLNSYLSQVVLSSTSNLLTNNLLILIPSFTAGVFEEAARYVGFRRFIKDYSYEKGLTYGAGHGGIESILLVGINVLSVGVILLTNQEMLPPLQLEVLLATPVFLPLVGVYERVMAIIVQVALSIMVLEFIRKKDYWFFVSAVGLHFLLDFLAVYVSKYGVLYAEAIVTVFALGMGLWGYNKLRSEGIIT